MTLKCNIEGTGASYGHSDAVCGELAPYVSAAGSTQATATLLRRLTRHIVTGGTGGVIVPPGVGLGDQLREGDELEVMNAADHTINVYPPSGALFLGNPVNTAISLPNGYSVSIVMDSPTRYIARYFLTAAVGGGGVTSVGLSLPTNEFTISGSPVTSIGTLTGDWKSQLQNLVFASPNGSSGTPGFRSLVNNDLPDSGVLAGSYTNSNVTVNSKGIITSISTGSGGGAGTVTSVGLSMPGIFSVTGSPVTTSGTLAVTLANESANTVFAGPTTGSPAAPTFRALVVADLPNNGANPTGTVGSTAVNGSATTWMRSDAAPPLSANLRTADILWVIDGAGSVITTGIKYGPQIDFNCTILANTVLLDQSGSIVIDVWKDTYANYPPTNADSITASAKPTVSSATKSTDSTLTGWTTTITAGDILRFNVDSVSTATWALISLKVIKI